MQQIAAIEAFAKSLNVEVQVQRVPAGGFELTFAGGLVRRAKTMAQAKDEIFCRWLVTKG